MDSILFQKELFVPSNFEGLNRCLDVIVEIKKAFDLNFDTMFGLHTIIVESVENAIIHGNKGVRELDVRIFISITSTEIFVEIEDRGDGFDISGLRSPVEPSNLQTEGGRGIFFIKMLSTSCSTNVKGNIIRIKLNR